MCGCLLTLELSRAVGVGLNELLGVLLNEEETMEYTAKLPTEVGLYRHRWDFRGQMREQVLFVGYTNVRAPRLQGSEPNAYMPRNLKCCKPDEHLHADRLTPKEWGGWWARIETPNPQLSGGVAVRLSARLGVTSEDDNMDNPQERAKRLATNAAEEFVRCNGIPTGAPDQFVFHGADLADEYFQDCLAHLKWAGECVVFEHDEETTVILGDYTLGSFE